MTAEGRGKATAKRIPTRFLAVILWSAGVMGCERRGSLEAPTCDVNEAGIGDSTLGPLHIGEEVAALRVRCAAVSDTVVAREMTGWVDSLRGLRLVVRGAPVIAIHENDRVIAMRVESPVFQTNDSIGVGSPVSRWSGLRGIRVTPTEQPGRARLLDRRRCGVEYELSGWAGPPPLTLQEPPVTGTGLASWPETIRVVAVTVLGCRGASSDIGIDSVSEALADSAARADSLRIQMTPSVADSAVSALPLPPPVVAGPMAAPATTAATNNGRAPTSAPPTAASSSELDALRGALVIPVQGVKREQLRDTYAEARGTRVHEAIDIIAPRGTPVISATDGRLLRLFSSQAGGLMVYASDPSDRFILLYAHLDRYADGLVEGAALRKGQVIGYVGTTGNAPPGTPHLHFGILRGEPSKAWWRGTPVNPYTLLR